MNDKTLLTLFSRRFDLSFLKPLLERADPQLEVVIWPDPRFREAEVAAGWEVPPGLYAEMPRLKLVHSIAAGVDNVIAGEDLGKVSLCRVVDPSLSEGMVQFVLWSVLHFHRKLDQALANQARRVWSRPRQEPASACRVGLMGLGELGGRLASVLPGLGYPVNGWARTRREVENVKVFAGQDELPAFLAATDILVCLLPLTSSTRGILCKRSFDLLPKGAALVHVGRGEHLVEADLSEALASGQLRGAVVDVFEKEPLPEDHPFWTTPGLVVTPHMATMASYEAIAAQIAGNAARMRRGEALQNTVDLGRGY